MKSLSRYFSLVKFSHSVFALPFALQGAWLAAGGVPSLRALTGIVVCAVSARTAAMGFNRLVDRRIDARNPRTSQRELPSGTLSVAGVRLLITVCALLFVAAAFWLNRLSGWLSFPVLAVLFAYSYFKRFTWLVHAMLALCLAIAPLGAWVAVRGDVAGDLRPVLLLSIAVWTWVMGFDLIYACQDADFDRKQGLHSIPARFGVARALRAASILHAATVAALCALGFSADLGWIWALAVVGASLLLIWEHGLVSPEDLSRVDLAFFTLNGWVGVGLFVGLVLDRGLVGGGA